MSTWGALRPAESRNGPSRLLCPSACVIGTPVQSSTLRARNPSLGFGEGCATRTSIGLPPQAGRLGLELDTWQDSPLRRNQALPSMIPHRSTKLGTLAQRRGIEGGVVEQTRTAPAARLRAKAHSADALAAVNTRTVSKGGEMPDAEGIPLRPRGDLYLLLRIEAVRCPLIGLLL